MGNYGCERKTTGWAAMDASGLLSPYTYNLRETGAEDVYVKVICCGICHTDAHQIKNDLGQARYPMVPGHEVVGEVLEVGSSVSKFIVGDRVGVGRNPGRELRKLPPMHVGGGTVLQQEDLELQWRLHRRSPHPRGLRRRPCRPPKILVKIPEGMEVEQAAPLLCAGVTVYSPLKHFGLDKSGLRGGILGLGGVGHMGVKIAKAMGHHVVVISSSDKKRVEAVHHLGADEYVVSSDAEQMKQVEGSLDYIIDTVPVAHALEPYLSLLRLNGKLILTGVINTPLQFINPAVMLGKR